MRIAFVDNKVGFSIPLGITGLASVLRQGGHEVSLFVIGSEKNETIKKLSAFKPDAVAFSIISGNQHFFDDFAQSLKKHFAFATI